LVAIEIGGCFSLVHAQTAAFYGSRITPLMMCGGVRFHFSIHFTPMLGVRSLIYTHISRFIDKELRRSHAQLSDDELCVKIMAFCFGGDERRWENESRKPFH